MLNIQGLRAQKEKLFGEGAQIEFDPASAQEIVYFRDENGNWASNVEVRCSKVNVVKADGSRVSVDIYPCLHQVPRVNGEALLNE